MSELDELRARVEDLERTALKSAQAIAALADALASVSGDLTRVCACVNDIADDVYGELEEEESDATTTIN